MQSDSHPTLLEQLDLVNSVIPSNVLEEALQENNVEYVHRENMSSSNKFLEGDDMNARFQMQDRAEKDTKKCAASCTLIYCELN
ncbi:hypothetical protein OUZ56_021817 [Daphnia magna]|uniref:Uncharacterized protein n=1 Tax=Daphnia magna TaxID=35525 RepID=A0ABR0AUR9_9CRUS|nr:hypothetical protein OUZ56_021817 [Daphnia magna]